MNRRLIYVYSLIGFFLLWGLFSFVASAPESEVTLFGLGALILILLLFNAARKPVATYVEAEEPSDEA